MSKASLERVRRILAGGEVPGPSGVLQRDGVLHLDDAVSLVDALELETVPIDQWVEMAAKASRSHLRWQEMSEAWRTDADLTEDAELHLTNGHPAIGNRYQADLVEGRGFPFPSPYDDRRMQAVASVPISIGHYGVWPVLYEFDSDRLVIAGVSCGWGGSLDFLWLVEDNLVIHKAAEWTGWVTPQTCIAHYLCVCTKFADMLPDYRAAQKSTALLFGFMYNLGHYFWNDVAGVEKIVRMGAADNVDVVYARTSAWLPASYLFPDFADRIQPSENHEVLCRRIFADRHLIVRSTASAMDAALAERIRAAAWRSLADHPERERAFKVETGRPAFTVFFNMRNHNKAWFEQVEGLVAIVAEMEQRSHPIPRIYLDGFADCEPLVAQIRQTLGARARIVDGAHAILAETLLWAFKCDVFIAVIGSGLVLPTWIADKPGVCHADTGHMPQLDFWSRVRRPTWPLRHPEASEIENTSENFYANYHLEPRSVVRLFVQQLDALEQDLPEPQDPALTRMLAHAYRFGGEAVSAREMLSKRYAVRAERLETVLDARDAMAAELKALKAERDGLAAELQDASRHLAAPPGHPSSPIVDVETLEDPFRSPRTLLPLDVKPSLTEHLHRWKSLRPLLERLPCLQGDSRRYDAAFPAGDALMLQVIMATHGPARCVQLGPSSALDAIRDGAVAFCARPPAMTLVAASRSEPPGPYATDLQVLAQGVERAPLELFEDLASGDLLSVETSHVSKTGSDVNHVLFEVLPRLQPGVNIYMHTIFWPFEYPRNFIYEQRRSWNELYAVRAFLAGNDDYEIVFFNDYFAQFAPKSAQADCPAFFQDRLSGLWLRKTGGVSP